VRTRSNPGEPMTLGNAAAARVRLIVWCNECGHRGEIDPADLAGRLGEAFPVPQIPSRLRCGACEGRRVSFVVSGTAGR
jgi:hypothetical protein